MKYIYYVNTFDSGIAVFSSYRRAEDYCIRQGCHVEKYKTDYTTELWDVENNVLMICKEPLNVH